AVMKLARLALLPALAIGAYALSSTPPKAVPKVAPGAKHGIDLTAIDPSIAPGDDFFRYANGKWIARTEIPADRGSWSNGAEMTERTAKRTEELITQASKENAPAGSDARKIGDYYSTFMDEDAIEKKGLEPVKPALDAIAAVSNEAELARALGATVRADVDVLNNTNLETDNILGLWVAQDLDDPSRYAAFLLQGGLFMPDRDYYLDPSPRMADLRTKYQAHIATVLKLAGTADAEAKATRIFELERRIAEAHASRTDSGDVEKGNNHWTREEFDTKAPGLDWRAFFAAAGLQGEKAFVVWQPTAITGIAALAHSIPLSTWKEYLAFHAIEHFSYVLSRAFVDERFEFHGKALTGTPKQRERWKRGVTVTDNALGEAVGKLYVAKYFPASEKSRAEAMVKNELAAFGKRIDALAWMAPATKARAKAKLAVLKVFVGYPDKWRDLSGLQVVRGDAFGNEVRSEHFRLKVALEKLGRPVDRTEWVMNPQLVNAVNLPAMNALNFPAAILQPPNFDPSRPEVMDYGAAGMVIGHEISHSFDDQGALFDAEGRLKNWWTKEDFAHFHESAEKLAKQYDGYHPFPDL
ncbi:MAG TPA: M13 family metallopeptidase, partial [Thermoanaerobaculia bacterium]|nr:M13 family metallopeptidase [Thermoanaerobaculia bacterium]